MAAQKYVFLRKKFITLESIPLKYKSQSLNTLTNWLSIYNHVNYGLSFL